MLAELGLVDDVIARGLIEPKFRIWDRASREVIVEFDFGVLRNDTRFPYVVQCEQHKLANLAIERLRALAHANVDFSARVSALQQFEDRVEIAVEGAAGLAGSAAHISSAPTAGAPPCARRSASRSKAIRIPSGSWC